MKTKKKVTAKKVVKKVLNTLFPGKANYVGPEHGWFGFVHHGELFERTNVGIHHRIHYVKTHKPAKEIPIRLRHIIYLGDKLNGRISANNAARWTDGYRAERRKIKAAILRYARQHIDPLRWNGKTLTLANGKAMTG